MISDTEIVAGEEEMSNFTMPIVEEDDGGFEIGVRRALFKPGKPKAGDSVPAPTIDGLDHFVLTVADIERTIEFYTSTLGMTEVEFKGGRKALRFGAQKINLHQSGKEFEPHARAPTPGSADICFVTQTPLPNWIDHLESIKVDIVEGPVARTGAVGAITSIYIRDPDLNLVEIACYD